MIYGYARVSTATQGRDGNSLEDQVAALEKYGCQKIIKEAFTGKTMDRPKFLNLLEVLQEGDTLVVCKLDRFARTAIEGVQVVRELFERGITRLPWRPTRGSLTSPSYLVRNRTLGPPLENNPEIPPSSREEGLRLLRSEEHTSELQSR